MKTHPPPRPRVSIVVLTHNRRAEVLRTVGRLRALPERPPIVVVDNASDDGTRDALRAEHPDVRVIALPDNLGAAARNAGVREVQTRYVAFCDDDTFWAPGALSCAADALDMHPHVAVISARVLVGPEEHEDPTCALMAHSPLCGRGLPGPALLGFMAGACVFRTRAYLCMGGYEQRLFIGAEESLLALDLAACGWSMAYVPQVVCHHHPSQLRDAVRRGRLLARNTIWVAWLRRPVTSALRATWQALQMARRNGCLCAAVADALVGAGWVARHRRVVPPRVEAAMRVVERARGTGEARGLI